MPQLLWSRLKSKEKLKKLRSYIGNGKVVWTDGNIQAADRVERQTEASEQSLAGRETPDLPF